MNSLSLSIFNTSYHSPLGRIIISGTEQYLTAVSFANEGAVYNDDSETLPELFHNAKEQLIGYFNGVRKQFDLPIAQEGTEFQQSVWSQLNAIPYGKTISYQDLAKRLGNPKVIRAAASTNGKNHVAIIVPCHRVIGSKQDLVGYGSGIWRKRWLLEHEAKFAYGVQTLF